MTFFKGYLKLFTGSCLLAALVSCGPEHKNGIESGEGVGATGVPIASLLEKPEDIVFADIQKHVLNGSCVVCHQPGDSRANVDVTTYESVTGKGNTKSVVSPFSPETSTIYETLIVPSGSRHMPPFGKPQLSENQINLVYQWVANGAKQEKTQQVERPKPLSEELQPYFEKPQIIDYQIVNKYVFEDSCNKCHSSNGATPNVDNAILYGHNTTTYQDVVSNEGVVYDKRGKSRLENFIVRKEDGTKKLQKGSRLYKSIAINQTMPPSENGYKPMDSLRIKLLKLWLLNCAIEDYSSIDPETDDLKEKPDKNGNIRRCPKPVVEEV